MTWPFKLDEPPKINMKDLEIARKASYQQTAFINKKRSQGIEPSIVYSNKGSDAEPSKFAMEMPTMPKHDRNAERRRRRKEAKK